MQTIQLDDYTTEPMAERRYSILYADPPWYYPKRNNQKTRFGAGAAGHYPLMRTADICHLPVADIADDRCMLFLWATPPRMPDALQVINDWGFQYITYAFVWIKTNKRNGKPCFGPGFYTASNAEVVLLGRKGKPLKESDSVSSVIMAPRREHSRKPDEVRDRIVQLCGNHPRIELFAREQAIGWDHWGNHLARAA